MFSSDSLSTPPSTVFKLAEKMKNVFGEKLKDLFCSVKDYSMQEVDKLNKIFLLYCPSPLDVF